MADIFEADKMGSSMVIDEPKIEDIKPKDELFKGVGTFDVNSKHLI